MVVVVLSAGVVVSVDEDSGVEDSGVDDSGVDDSGVDDSGVDDSGVDGSGVFPDTDVIRTKAFAVLDGSEILLFSTFT